MVKWMTVKFARRRLTAILLTLTAVLCSPAGVCAIEGVAATVQPAAHGHACSQSTDKTFLDRNDDSCCSEPRSGFVTVLRFTLQKQASAVPITFDLGPALSMCSVTFRANDRRPPLVLRI